MLSESGRVVAVEVDAVWVETIRSSLCGSCAARAGCGHGVLARASKGKGLIKVRESAHVFASDCAINDEVDIELPESAVLHGSFLVYLLPLLIAIVGALVGDHYSEGWSLVGFVLGLAAGFALVRVLPRLTGSTDAFEPRLAALRKVSDRTLAVG